MLNLKDLLLLFFILNKVKFDFKSLLLVISLLICLLKNKNLDKETAHSLYQRTFPRAI